MKKKLIVSMLCTSMILGCVACGSNTTGDENEAEALIESTVNSYVEDTESSETDMILSYEHEELTAPNEEQSDSNIIRAEELYDEDDENYAMMESLQGKIKYLDQSATSIVIYAEDKVYAKKYSTIETIAELGEEPEWAQYFNNVEIGENVLYFADGKINCYNNNGVRFANIDFNMETDAIAEIWMNSSLNVMSKQDNGYMLKYYEKNDNDEWILQSEEIMTEFKNNRGDDISAQIKDILVIPGNNSGYEVYCRTNDDELYCVDSVRASSFTSMTTAEPIATNVENIYAIVINTTYTTVPVHSKSGDDNAVYAAAPGNSKASLDDNFEISFTMPDGHKPSEIKNIFECGSSIVFVFDNGDTYITDEIEETERVTYEMTKLEEISELISAGKVIDMVGGSSLENMIYLLMDTNELYYYEVE